MSRGPRAGRVRGAVLWGTDGRLVEVEAVVAPGLPVFHLIGLPEGAGREARHRVRTALQQAGIRWPPARVTVNLAPADLRKPGTACDLAVAAALLAALGQHRPDPEAVYVGELGLDGSVRPVPGLMAMLLAARRAGLPRVVGPTAAEGLAAGLAGLAVRPLRHVGELAGLPTPAAAPSGAPPPPPPAADGRDPPDWARVEGQWAARRALEIAAAGRHHLLLVGSPGVGKTLLVRGLPGILPPLGEEEAVEVTAIADAAGQLPAGAGLLRRRPFRAPHHTISTAALLGGGSPPVPGELTLAHAGVLFLDELPLFRRDALEGLRQPLEEGVIRLGRRGAAAVLPARVQLVAAMNPCPCGRAGEEGGPPCRCTEAALRRYRAALSGALQDRIDMVVWLGRADALAPAAARPPEPSAAVRRRVLAAWGRRHGRRAKAGDDPAGDGPCTAAARRLLDLAARRLLLSPRGLASVTRVAWTVADLEGCDALAEHHVAEALQYRPDPWPGA